MKSQSAKLYAARTGKVRGQIAVPLTVDQALSEIAKLRQGLPSDPAVIAAMDNLVKVLKVSSIGVSGQVSRKLLNIRRKSMH